MRRLVKMDLFTDEDIELLRKLRSHREDEDIAEELTSDKMI